MRSQRKQAAVFSIALTIGRLMLLFCSAAPARALDLETVIKDSIKNQLPRVPQEPIKVDRKNQKLEDLIQRQDIPYGYAAMIPLQGVNIKGLGQKAVLSLGENYFVVRSNTNSIRMSDLYKENRAMGKANYVTIDSIIHPYFSFVNRIHAETIKRQLLPMIKSLLASMLKVAVQDYTQSEDEDVRADIEGNVAFLSLAIKLLEPEFRIPMIGRVPQMVHSDYDSLVFARPAYSYIFERNEDFSEYKPLGWYRSSPELITFHRVKTWLSRLSCPINDMTIENEGMRSNNFRRSVLLYRCIDLARVDGKPGIDAWTMLVKGLFLLGAPVENWQDKNLYAHDYRSVFKTNSADLAVTLRALAEPLYRTKLLLAVRKQKPLSLGSTSIFDIEEAKADRETTPCFRFIPSIGYPEDPWLRYAANLYPKPAINTNVFPVALLDMNAWGAPQAANSLLDSSWAMDENMPRTVSELKRWVLRRSMTGQVAPVDCRIWNLLAPAWRLLPDGIQTALRGQSWGNRRLETVFSAWLDSRLSIAPLHYPQGISEAGSSTVTHAGSLRDKSGEKTASHLSSAAAGSERTLNPPAQARSERGQMPTSVKTSITGSDQTVDLSNIKKPVTATTPAVRSPQFVSPRVMAARRAARGHFLDPYPDFFNRLLADSQNMEKDMAAAGLSMDPQLKKELDDYTRLLQRLGKIAKDEVENRPLPQQDLNLLANIDLILEKIDIPLPACVSIDPPANFSSTASAKEPSQGFSMALGRPGLLYIILMNKETKDWTLARGAVYTYYEQYGNSLNEETLLNKIDQGSMQLPYWTEQFDFLQADKK